MEKKECDEKMTTTWEKRIKKSSTNTLYTSQLRAHHETWEEIICAYG